MPSDQVTRCPHCLAVFRVSAQQLAQAEGWLRCGQCQHAFDSTGLVVPMASADDGSGQRLDIQVFLQTPDRGASSDAKPPDHGDVLSAFEQALATFPLPAPASADGGMEPGQTMAQASGTLAAAQTPGQQAVPGRRGARILLACLLVLGLLQLAWLGRSAWWQSPWLAAAAQNSCERLGCTLAAWREPGHLQIESSRFVRTERAYRLEWALRNTSHWPLRMPAIELSLLAEDETVLARKVAGPAELQAPGRLAPEQLWGGVALVQVPEDMPVSGYRLLVFYP